MDPLDPLTEIINSGQAFSYAIALERTVWIIIGFFFIGAISKSLLDEMKIQNKFDKNLFFDFFKFTKQNKKESDNYPNRDR